VTIASLIADVRFRQFEHRGSHPIARVRRVVGAQNEALGKIGTVLWPLCAGRARFETLKRDLVGDKSFDVAGGNEVFGDVYGSRRRAQWVPSQCDGNLAAHNPE
jgi:hypothetical protein